MPQLEKISLDQCQLSLFPNLRNSSPRLTLPPDEAEALDCYEGLSAKFEDIASGLCKMVATMHCLVTD